MSRNFGIPNATSGAAPGEQQRPRSYSAHGTQRAGSNVIHSGFSPDSRVKEREPFIHPFELGSNLLFLFLLLAPIAIVGGICIAYAAFIA